MAPRAGRRGSVAAACAAWGDNPRMRLRFLEFDFSDDGEGHGSFDAMAAADPAQLDALKREVLSVLAWCNRQFGPAAPLEEGGDWDHALQAVQEVVTPLSARVDAGHAALDLQPQGAGIPRVTLSLTLVGTDAFCAAFRDAFGIE